MSSRRDFFKHISGGAVVAAGAFFSRPGWSRQRSEPGQQHRPILVGGRPVRVIDCFSHIAFPEIWKVIPKTQAVPPYMEQEAEKFRTQSIPPFDLHGSEMRMRISEMDAMGVDMEVLSVPYHYWADRPLTRDIVQIENEKLAQVCAAYPDRFVAFGAISMQFPDLAAEQMEDGVKKRGLRGFSVGGSVNGTELYLPKFYPIWAKAIELGTVIFLRPFGFNGVGDQTKPFPRFEGYGWMASTIGNSLELTLALAHLIEEETLDRFPNLKILMTRGGGYITSDDAMADKCGQYFPKFCGQVKKHPQEYYLKRIYYDSMHQTAEGLRHLIATVGVGQVVLGTDNSQKWNSEAIDRVLAVPGLSDADRIAILGGNAAKLLRIES